MKVLWAGTGDIPAGWPLLSHVHPFFHMFYIRSGKAGFLLNGAFCAVESGTCIIVPPNMPHELPEQHSLLDLYEVKFSVDDEKTARTLEENPIIRGNTAFIEQALAYIVQNWNGDGEKKQNADLFLYTMLLAVISGSAGGKEWNSAYVENSGYSKLTQAVMQFLEESHTEPFCLDNLAEKLEYNKRYLCDAFKQDTGVTILEYLNHIRIRHAVVCFYYNDVPIADIAQCVGYITSGHFTRVFKQLTGVTPSLFRDTHSLHKIDASENLRLTQTYISPFEKLLDGKILPLRQSMEYLKQLGAMAAGKNE